MRHIVKCTLTLLLLSAPIPANAQGFLVLEAGGGAAVPMGGTGQGRGVGPGGYVSLRLAPVPGRATFGVLADVGYMPGKTERACGSCVAVAQSALRASTFAAIAHFESPMARRGLYAEGGIGESWLALTAYSVTNRAAMLLAGVGAFAHPLGVPVRLGVQYHLYLSDAASGADLSPTSSVRLRVALWQRSCAAC